MCSFGQRKALRRYLGHLEFLGCAFLKLSTEALRHFKWLDSGIFIQRSGIFYFIFGFLLCHLALTAAVSPPFLLGPFICCFSHTPPGQPAMELSAAQLEDAVVELKRLRVIQG